MKSRSSPSPRSRDWNVWAWALTVPGNNALPGKGTSPGSGAWMGPTKAIRPSVMATARSVAHPAGVRTRSGSSLTGARATPPRRQLYRDDVVTAVHEDDLAGDPGRQVRGQEERGIADLAQLDVALERRLLGVMVEDRGE